MQPRLAKNAKRPRLDPNAQGESPLRVAKGSSDSASSTALARSTSLPSLQSAEPIPMREEDIQQVLHLLRGFEAPPENPDSDFLGGAETPPGNDDIAVERSLADLFGSFSSSEGEDATLPGTVEQDEGRLPETLGHDAVHTDDAADRAEPTSLTTMAAEGTEATLPGTLGHDTMHTSDAGVCGAWFWKPVIGQGIHCLLAFLFPSTWAVFCCRRITQISVSRECCRLLFSCLGSLVLIMSFSTNIHGKDPRGLQPIKGKEETSVDFFGVPALGANDRSHYTKLTINLSHCP